MIRLSLFQKTHYEALDAYKLDDNQANFTAPISYCIHERKDLQHVDRAVVTILYDNIPVGFFVLDQSEDKFGITDNPRAMMIRSFSVNPAYQGKGVGCEAMLQVTNFVAEHYTVINELTLSVNAKNKTAYRTYINADYVDNGKVIDGPMGTQNVLSKRLN